MLITNQFGIGMVFIPIKFEKRKFQVKATQAKSKLRKGGWSDLNKARRKDMQHFPPLCVYPAEKQYIFSFAEVYCDLAKLYPAEETN